MRMFWKALRLNAYHTMVSWPSWALLAFVVIFGIAISSAGSIASRKALIASVQDGILPQQSLDFMGIDAEAPMEEQVAAALDWQFTGLPGRVATNGLAWVSLAFAAFFVCRDYGENMFADSVKRGASRGAVFWAKWLWSVALFVLSSCLILLFMIGKYSGAAGRSAGQLARVFLLYAYFMAGWAAVCNLIAFCLKGPILTGGVILGFELIWSMLPSRAKVILPLAATSQEALWSMEPDAALIQKSVLITLAFLIVSAVGARIASSFCGSAAARGYGHCC